MVVGEICTTWQDIHVWGRLVQQHSPDLRIGKNCGPLQGKCDGAAAKW